MSRYQNRLTGDIYIEEINSEAFKAKLDTLNGKELYTDSLNINCFDIKDLNKFSFSNNFKLGINSKIILGSKAKKITGPLNHDLTPYPKVGELLTLLQNSKLKSYITVKDVYITGNVKDLLPLLVGPNSIKEVNGGVKFLNHTKFSCDEINLTEYKGEENNTVSIALEQFLEFRKRTDEVYKFWC